MWPLDWLLSKDTLIVVSTALPLVLAVARTIRQGHLNTLLWSTAAVLIVATLLIEGRFAAAGMLFLAFQWSVRTLINNCRRIDQLRVSGPERLPRYAYRRLGGMNRWLLPAIPCLAAACGLWWVSLKLSSVPALLGLVCVGLGLSQGLKRRSRNLASDEDDASPLSRLLFALSFPEKWGRQADRKFSGFTVGSGIVAMVLIGSLVSTSWQDATDLANARISNQLSGGAADDEPDERQPGEAAPGPPEPSTPNGRFVPAFCADARLRTDLAAHQLTGARMERVLKARARYSWPIVGCTIASVSTNGGSWQVVYEGGLGPALIVDDGREANAAVEDAAAVALEQVAQAGAGRYLVALSSAARAALGRWYLETWSDGTCQLLESRDQASLSMALTYGDTVRVASTAEEIGAFPMIDHGPDGGVEVAYVAVDATSPNGYGVVEREPITNAAGSTQVGAPSCASILVTLKRVASGLEAAAQARSTGVQP